MLKQLILNTALLLSLAILQGCSGGTQVAEGGIGGTGISMGTVTGFGSVIVNGVHFDTTGAVVTLDDGSIQTNINDADINTLLAEGMVVTVKGDINADGLTGTANTIVFNDVLEGPVESKSTNSFTVLSHTVLVTSGVTQFHGAADLASLSLSDVVEVSGYYRDNGDIVATYIKVSLATEFEITGEVSLPSIGKFNIHNLVINWNGTIPDTGDYVEVKGTLVAGQMLASSVENKTRGFDISDANKAELEGVVTLGSCVASVPCDIEINGQKVQVSSSTTFDGGVLADIKTGLHIEVEGALSSGVLYAEQVEFEDNIELQSEVVSGSITTNSLQLEFGATDITVNVDPDLTEYENCFPDIGGISDLDNIVVRGRKTGTSSIQATRLDCTGTVGDVKLQGLVESPLGYDMLTVLGITVYTTGFADDKFLDDEGNVLGRTNFFASTTTNSLVELEGTITGGNITWDKVSLDK